MFTLQVVRVVFINPKQVWGKKKRVFEEPRREGKF